MEKGGEMVREDEIDEILPQESRARSIFQAGVEAL